MKASGMVAALSVVLCASFAPAISPRAGRTQTPAKPASIHPCIDDAPTKAKDYDWLERHELVLQRIKSAPTDLILIGDSITHGWGGDPVQRGKEGGPHDLWDKYFRAWGAVNMGFGWDRTEHVLWRLQNGEIDGIHPKVAVVLIGTNNLWRDSVDDVATGITEIVHTVRRKLRRTKVLLLGIFPRDHEANTDNRKKIAAINEKISRLGKERGVTYLNINNQLLAADGTLSPDVMPDFLHPNHRGYEIWAEAMDPTLTKLLGH